MALNLNEEATLRLKTETGQFNADIKALNDRAAELSKTLKEIEKTGPGKKSEEWQAVKTELDNTRKASESLRKEVDITTLSYGQLENHVKQLARDLKTLKPGTDEFVAASAKLQTARAYLEQVSTSAKGVGTASKQAAKDLTGLADSSLTFGELKTKVEQLKAKLDTLSPASKEFIATAKQLNTTQKAYDDVRKSVDDASKALNKQILEAKNSDLTFGQLETKVKLLAQQLKTLKPGTEDFIKASKNLGQTEKDFNKVSKEVDHVKKTGEELGKPTIWQKIVGGVNSVSTAFQAFVALQIIGYIIDIGKAIFETTAKFEKYEKVLTTALGGNVKMAKESLAALKELGAQTAFSVDELTDGYVKMVNRGLRPSKEEMVALTDLAASQGKTFDQLVEGLLDAATGEFERLKEFGTRASKAGEEVAFKFNDAQLVIKNTGQGFDVMDKATGKVVNTFKNQEDATLGVMTALGKMQGVGGQNAEMMETLSGKSSNLGDSFDALAVELGTVLRPIFIAILDLIGYSIPVLSVLGKAIGSVLLMAKSFVVGLVETFTNTGQMLYSLAQAAWELTQGNVQGAKKSWEETKKYGQTALNSMQENVKLGVKQVVDAWKDPNGGTTAAFAGKEQGKKYQGGLTEEQKKAQKEREKEAEKARKKEETDHKKHLEEVKKANEKALKELAKIEADTHIASIKDEEARDMVKLMVKSEQRAQEIMDSVADQKLKDQQLKALQKELEAELTKVHAEHTEKRRKKAEEEEKKRLEVEKMIIAQEQQAENALFDWRELMAKNNATKLAQVHRDRSNKQLQLTRDRLDAEEAAELAKAARDAVNTDQAEAAQKAIRDRYNQERKLATAKNADEIARIERELKEKKIGIWTEAGNAFSSLLKGDLNAFVDHLGKMVQGEKAAWQKRLEENMGKYQAVAQMAQAAVQFLNQLEQQKAERAIAEARRERDEKIRLLQDQIAAEKAAQDVAEAEKQRVTQESNDRIQAIKSSTQQTIASLEQQYRELSSTQEKAKLQQQLDSYRENADSKSETARQTADEAIEAAQREAKESIAAAQQAEKESIRAAQNEKDQKIDAAEATRDAEIAAINRRKDIDQATRQQLLAEAKDAFEQQKKMAQDEAQEKIDQAKKTAQNQKELAQDTSKLKIELAKDTQDAELKAIEAVQKGDEKAAKEILAKAKEDQKEKIRLAKEEADKKIEEAEKEKREKLKKVEAEKQTRIQNQKELNRSIEAENKKAAETERLAKQKAWEAQKKADIASAVITGALAALKALASGFWPVNLAFAAATAIATGVQVALIKKQPTPVFEKGGFIPSGGRHGSVYGTGGLAIVDRQTGREQGEMEGGEAIISREQTQANLPLIRRMFANARTPGRRNRPVIDREPGALGFRDGGLLAPAHWKQNMYLFGGLVRRKTPPRFDEGGYSSYGDDYSSSDGGQGISEAEARAAAERAEQQGKEQLRLLEAIKDGVEKLDANQATALKALENGLKQTLSASSLTERLARAQTTASITTAIEKLGQDFVQALGRTSTQQTGENDQLASLLQAGLTQLENGLKVALNTQGNGMISAITLSRLSQTAGLNSLSQTLVTQLEHLEKENALATQKSQLILTRLEKALVAQLEELSQNTQQSLEGLADQTERALKGSADQTTRSVDSLSVEVRGLRGAINGVEGATHSVRSAVHGVEGAVWGTNQAGRLDALISAISTFGK